MTNYDAKRTLLPATAYDKPIAPWCNFDALRTEPTFARSPLPPQHHVFPDNDDDDDDESLDENSFRFCHSSSLIAAALANNRNEMGVVNCALNLFVCLQSRPNESCTAATETSVATALPYRNHCYHNNVRAKHQRICAVKKIRKAQ